ncbi:MAG: tRNA guanosine(34) transglycosylase Tgt, partial [Thermoplasmatota archaeon]
MFALEALDGRARAGTLRTCHGDVPTPVFMPVATKAVVKTVTPEELGGLGVRALISNSLHLHLRPGEGIIAELGGLHAFMGWGRALFTDSGGFQLIRSGFDLKVRESGVRFRSPVSGEPEELTPERSLEIQNALGSDVAMALDDCPRYGAPREAVAQSAQRTVDWARRALDARVDEGQLFFGIAQGGLDEGLRKECADALVSLDLDGYGIGGLSIGEPQERTVEAMGWTLSCLPLSKPRYMMGLGSTPELLSAVEMGVDVFDSAFPTRNARHWTVMTRSGSYSLRRAESARLRTGLDEGCICPTCRCFTRAYLHHLAREGEMLGMRLVSIHNLFFLQWLMAEAREAIKARRFQAFKEEFLAGLGAG